ncbi:COMM domain-containing protein 7-like [Portunus trituberculatus]|uniref:COMM domain-containing protein 7-like n=1 Tax=Portunus trituberculatus TaxID=210409 RepID=UPI001E1D11DF|nr:COMM domain-containing protein 7-like [Portunus trituberculatus]
MEHLAQHHIAAIKALPQDSFLTGLEAGLQSLSEKSTNVERPSWYSVEVPKNSETEAFRAMCETLAMMGQPGGPTEKELTARLNSSGLQEDRIRLLLTQHDQLVKSSNVQKQTSIPSEELVDIHWKLGVVAGSSEEGEAGRTFVQVNFICQAPGGSRSAKLVEMSLDKFYDFLHQFEKCKASLEHSHLL